MRWASQAVPRPTVVVTLRSPVGRSLVSTRRALVFSSRSFMSRAARNRRSPCSVRIRPRAWRWNSGAFSSRSRALICRLTADWLRPMSSPARVKLPASATLRTMRILSQSKATTPVRNPTPIGPAP